MRERNVEETSSRSKAIGESGTRLNHDESSWGRFASELGRLIGKLLAQKAEAQRQQDETNRQSK